MGVWGCLRCLSRVCGLLVGCFGLGSCVGFLFCDFWRLVTVVEVGLFLDLVWVWVLSVLRAGVLV